MISVGALVALAPPALSVDLSSSSRGGLVLVFPLFLLWKNLAMDPPCGPSLFFCYIPLFSWVLGPSLSYGPLLPISEE